MPLRRKSTPDTSSMEMPKFGDLQGSYYSLPLKPPFSITNLSCRLFPLRANRNTVQSFVDNYVNILPPEIGHFRPCAPHIFLMMLDYGSLALEATNLGWFSQHEIMFCIPTEWYRVEKGKWVFQDWAMLTPFIFVDDDLSLNMGRTVAGWPKTYASMTPTLSAWMKDPLAPVSEATASAMVFPELYAGKRQEQRVFLEIERTAPMSNLRLPFNTGSPIAPWSIAANAAKSLAGLQRDALGWMGGLGLMPMHDGSTPENYMAMMRNMAKSANPLRPDMASTILNVKQFRASEEPDKYCYQAVTLGAMKFTKFNGIGLLGEQAVMLGDASGGYSVKIHEWPSIPITRLLGLEVEKRWRGDGVNVAELKPVMPYWYDSNMDYETGYNVGWRSRDGVWHDRHGKTHQPKMIAGAVAPEELLYNSALGPNAKPIAGPFRFSGTSIRVLPLLAKRKNLDAYLNDYLNAPLEQQGERFTLWAPETPDEGHGYVYMTATSFGDVTSGTNNVGNWADRELAFLLPVRHERKIGNRWQVVGVGMVPAYTYVDNVAAAISGTEVLGIPTIGATFDEAESSWMSEEGPARDAAQTLLLVDAEILPAVGEGERTQKRRIVEIMQGKPVEAADPLAWRITGDRWSAILRHELGRKNATKEARGEALNIARAMGLQLLGTRMPFSMFTMKQFRDNANPDDACYQSIVRIQRTLVEVLDFREIEEPLVVRMHDFPTQPLVETLGLIGKPIRDDGVGVAYALQPIRPFWLRVAKEEELGEPIMFRAGTSEWTRPRMPDGTPRPFPSFFDEGAAITTPRSAGVIQDEGDPRRLETTLDDERAANGEKAPGGTFTLDETRAAVEQIDPQMVIESMLSREWGNWDDNARWRQARRDLQTRYAQSVSGAPAETMALAASLFFEGEWLAIQARGSDPVVVKRAREMLDRFNEFNAARAPMEGLWTTLANWGVMRLYPKLGVGGLMPLLPTNIKIVGVILGFLSAVDCTRKCPVIGEPASLDGRKDFAVRDNDARMTEIFNETLTALHGEFEVLMARPTSAARVAGDESTSVATNTSAEGDPFQVEVDKAWGVWELLREAVMLARARCELQREALMSQLSKAGQKPDYCVRRDSAGPEVERLFPRAESWDGEWYVGATTADALPIPKAAANPLEMAEHAPRVASKTAATRRRTSK